MGLTVASLQNTVIGDRRLTTSTVTFDSSYASGGESLTGQNLGLPAGRVDFVVAESASGYVFSYDYTNKKLLAYVTKDPGDTGGANVVLQEAGAIDLSALAVRVLAIGV